MNLEDIAEELMKKKVRIEKMEADLKKEIDEFHKYGQKVFKIKPSTQPFSIADIAQVVAQAIKMERKK